jgi:hypothetical protein
VKSEKVNGRARPSLFTLHFLLSSGLYAADSLDLRGFLVSTWRFNQSIWSLMV